MHVAATAAAALFSSEVEICSHVALDETKRDISAHGLGLVECWWRWLSFSIVGSVVVQHIVIRTDDFTVLCW